MLTYIRRILGASMSLGLAKPTRETACLLRERNPAPFLPLASRNGRFPRERPPVSGRAKYISLAAAELATGIRSG